jgi:hypothetical protein
MNYIEGNALIPLTEEDIIKEHNELTNNIIHYRIFEEGNENLEWILHNSYDDLVKSIKIVSMLSKKYGDEELILKEEDPYIITTVKKIVKGLKNF